MSHAEILAELPSLSQEERQDLINRLWELQERDLISGGGLSGELKKLLDDELDDYERTGDSGTPREDFISELRAKVAR